jgi:hypothetical protein
MGVPCCTAPSDKSLRAPRSQYAGVLPASFTWLQSRVCVTRGTARVDRGESGSIAFFQAQGFRLNTPSDGAA